MTLKVEFSWFPTRLHRAEYIARRFQPELHGRVLDVGCDQGSLRDLLTDVDYLGIDAGGTPDMLINLEKAERLPFADSHFESVVCTDVLEHLDNLHAMFAELLRVSRGTVILSLPNCWSSARQPLQRGRGHFLHYGLPVEPPVDRHKWFFNVTEAVEFLVGQQSRLNYTIEQLHVTEKPRAWARQLVRRLYYMRQSNYLNRYSNTIWAVLRKSNPAAVAERRAA